MPASDALPAIALEKIRHRLELVAFALALAYALFLAGCVFQGYWLIDGVRAPIANDFVNVWAAGKLVLDGHPALAYDWDIQRGIELALLGQDFPGYFAWHYPPPFLFVASLLAQFPYPVAFIG